ncbi:hypothetical protein [Streptomyces sp. AC627_RSS907]|uniref:hypothetical protein n=1 Tax=Streptomyces sp. AC627_RSS907 TaxID=2823684 RepID=UPI001C230DEE|nr:hypothetical protein [Streptomyces sp. AC627_RSS907]
MTGRAAGVVSVFSAFLSRNGTMVWRAAGSPVLPTGPTRYRPFRAARRPAQREAKQV